MPNPYVRQIQIDEVGERMSRATQAEVVRNYKASLKTIKKQMVDLYESYEKNGVLTFAEMAKYNRIDGMWTGINKELNLLTGKNATITKRLSAEVFQESYYRTGFMFEEATRANLSFSVLNPKVIQASVENPISGLTLNETLQKNRVNIIRDVKQTVTQGLITGSSYKDMATRLTKTFEGDVVKANRVVRTEAHRNKEAGSLAAGKHAKKLGVKFTVTWISTLDERTREQHGQMDGQVAADKSDGSWEFTYPDGLKTQAPGMSGYGHQDINCRCSTMKRPVGYEPSFRRVKGEGVSTYKTYEDWAASKGIPKSKYSISTPAADYKGALEWTIKNTVTDLSGADPYNSLGQHLDASGNLTPERQRLHQELLEQKLGGVIPDKDQPEFVMLGGGPASGKSFTKNKFMNVKNDIVDINPDDFKVMLPEYKQGLLDGNNLIANFVHEESSALNKRAMDILLKHQSSFLLDGVGDGSAAAVLKKITKAKAAGYKVVGKYVSCPVEQAQRWEAARFARTGRQVKAEVLLSNHKGVSQILPEVAKDFDDVELWSTDERFPTQIIAKGGAGVDLTPLDNDLARQLFMEFLKKAL